MGKYRFATVLCLGFVVSSVSGAPAADDGNNDASRNFKVFSSNLLMESDLDEFSIEKGAAISAPFGVGYMLANIYTQVWNVSNDGFERVLKSPKTKIPAQYASLIEKMNKANMITNNVLYVRDKNSSVTLPEGSQSLKTEVTFADFINDWKTSWFAMNDMISNNSGHKLNDQLVPKGGWWGGAFYPFTMSAYINTVHFKSSWEKTWTSIGERKFWDGYAAQFYELEGKFPIMETANYTAVAIQLADKEKYAVFVLPKGKLVNFIRVDLPTLLQKVNPASWEVAKESKRIQTPALNITLLDQHYKKLETLGINHTFCMPDGEEPVTGASKENVDHAATGKNHRGPFFTSPIVQAHHIQLAPDFIEVASATGTSVNSEEKLKEDHAPDYDYGPAPPSDNGPILDAPLAQLAALAGEEDDDTAEVVLPVVLDERLAKSLEEGKMDIKGVDLTIEDPKTNETFTAQGSIMDEQPPSSDVIADASAAPVLLDSAKPSASEPVVAASSTTEVKVEANAVSPTTTVAPESQEKDTLLFNQPFFWYLYDKEMGPLYFGTVHSLATYKKEYGLETDEDFWLFDAYKTLLWNCP